MNTNMLLACCCTAAAVQRHNSNKLDHIAANLKKTQHVGPVMNKTDDRIQGFTRDSRAHSQDNIKITFGQHTIRR